MCLNAKVRVFVRLMLVAAVSMSIPLVTSRTASQDIQEMDSSKRQPEWASKLREYYRMKDPKAAAKLMLEDAAARGIDADWNPRPYQWRPGAILVPSGGFTPPEGERSFVDSVAALLSRGVAQGDTVCLLQFERSVSLREIATMMSMGVRFLREPSDPNIVKLPLTLVQAVHDLPYVRWMGPYLPSYKYKHHSQYDSDHPFTVLILEDDEEMIQKDVASIGGTITFYGAGHHVTMRMPASQISALARFWWVEEIYQYFVSPGGLLPLPTIPDQAPAQGFINPFHAQDSRRLVSRNTQSSWRGQDQVIGISDSRKAPRFTPLCTSRVNAPRRTISTE